MNKIYNVRITGAALSDMAAIYDYIAEKLRSPQNAVNQYNRIADKIESLESFPERAPVLKTEIEYPQNIRGLPIDNYIILYMCKDGEVIVLRVLYGASDITNKFREV